MNRAEGACIAVEDMPHDSGPVCLVYKERTAILSSEHKLSEKVVKSCKVFFSICAKAQP